MKPVVIVGAGLAGLTCARALKRRGFPFHIYEAADRIGGRLKTDVVGNYRLDRGYQVFFTGYPNAKSQLEEDRLDLQRFEPGAQVVWDGEIHEVSRNNPLKMALSGFLSTGDKLRLGRWTSDLQWMDSEDIDEMPESSIDAYLRDEGFSEQIVERFFRPFLGSVFLDPALGTSSRQLAFVWRSLTDGETTVPALGMEEIPRQIGETFGPDVLTLNAGVDSIILSDGRAQGVRLASGEEVDADRVVLACDAETAAKLSGLPIGAEFSHSLSLYFSAPEAPIEGGWIVLNGNMRGITAHVAPISNVNPASASTERHLICATILGERPETDEQLAEIVKAETRLWFPNRNVEAWELLRGYRCRNAQMRQPPGFRRRLPDHRSSIGGLFFAGEMTTNSSIDGAIQSGLECAEAVIGQLSASAA